MTKYDLPEGVAVEIRADPVRRKLWINGESVDPKAMTNEWWFRLSQLNNKRMTGDIMGKGYHKPLTIIQQNILDYCREYVAENNNQPTVRNIQAKFEYKSSAAPVSHLQALLKKGYIEYYTPRRFRFTIRK